jgi:protein-S-isoprenylcysteine O-methyltransferase Ste14
MSVMRDFPDIPPVWAAGVALAQGFVAWVLPGARYDALFADWLCVVLGFGLVFWSAYWFWQKKTSIEPGDTPKALIIEGPFRINRNPIYTGMVLILLGWGLWLGALTAIVLAFALIPILTRRFILPEEKMLRDVFGEEAEAYIAKSRRW